MNYDTDIKSTFSNNLAVLRKTSGLSLEEMADRVGLSKQSIHKYESGEMNPKMSVLYRLSTEFNVSEDYWFKKESAYLTFESSWNQFASEPDWVNHFQDVQFREHENIESEQIIDLVKMESFKKFLSYETLEYLVNQRVKFKNPVEDLQIKNSSDAHKAAIQVRKKWKLYDNPITNVVSLFETKGIRVIEVNVDKSFEGLSARFENFPLIVLNGNTSEVTRKRFTACHELAHLVLQVDHNKISLAKLETICNQFAATLLLPRDLLVNELGMKRTDLTAAEISLIKEKYGISRQAVLLSALFCGIIDERQYDRLTNSTDYPNSALEFRASEIPTRFKTLLIIGVSEKKITKEKAMQLAEESLVDLEDFEL